MKNRPGRMHQRSHNLRSRGPGRLTPVLIAGALLLLLGVGGFFASMQMLSPGPAEAAPANATSTQEPEAANASNTQESIATASIRILEAVAAIPPQESVAVSAVSAVPPPPRAIAAKEKYQLHDLDYGVYVEVPASWVILLKQGAGQEPPVEGEKELFIASSSARPAQASITITVTETNPITQSDSATLAEIQEVLGKDLYKHVPSELASGGDLSLYVKDTESIEITDGLFEYTFPYKLINSSGRKFQVIRVLVPTPAYTVNIEVYYPKNSDGLKKIVDKIIKSIKVIPLPRRSEELPNNAEDAVAEDAVAEDAQNNAAAAEAKEKNLYEGFWSGMSKGEITGKHEVVLLRAMGSIFSAGGTTFAENTWEQYLNFKDDKLTEVILGMRSQDKSKINRILLAVAKALRQRGFIIANYESDEDKLVFDGPSSETFILNGVAGKSVSFRAYDQAEVEKLMNDKGVPLPKALEAYPPGQLKVRCIYKKDLINVYFARE